MEINEFINKNNIIAVVGVSTNRDKWGWKIYNELKYKGFLVYPINPKYDKINNDVCHPNLNSLPKKPDVVITIIPPEVTEKIVKQCKDLKINKVWMQPGSESEKAITFCKNNNIKIVFNACFVMDNLNKFNKIDSEKSKEELIEELKKEVENCKKCDLWKNREKPLVGDGNMHSKIMLIGESPGYYEDKQNKAFVGEAGKILDLLLEQVGLKREDIYITNVLKCHPPKNHNPNRQEINSCIGYLHRQIGIIKPKIIISLGKYATEEIFKKFGLPFSRISELHGKTFHANTEFRKIIILPSFHPAVACYHSRMIDTLKGDFKKLKRLINGEY
ncbi:MAG: hypothetical protein DRO88_12205 [Promethearchaeia archaeon]|nr:MAG: hypothetical protein DRO88_12205 [Candidatus Lokiarchaeia archaeon]